MQSKYANFINHVTKINMSAELRRDPISEAENEKVEAHLLQLRTASEQEIQAVLGQLYQNPANEFILRRFLESREIVRGKVQRLFEESGQKGDVINKTMKDIYYRPSHFKSPHLADFAVYSDLTHYGTKLSDKFTIITARNVLMVKGDEGEAYIKEMHAKFQSKTAGLKDVKKHAVAQTLAHQYLGLEITMLAARFELSKDEIFEIINDLNQEDLQNEGLKIAIRNGIAILTTLRSDRKIYILDTPQSRLRFLRNPEPEPKPAPKPFPLPLPKPAPKPLPKPAPKPFPKPFPKPQPKSKTDTPPGGRSKKRNKTLSLKRLTRGEIDEGKTLVDVDTQNGRPQNRGECIEGYRPCPYVGCQFNLYLDVNPDTGSITLNFPNIPVWEMRESCALDIADRGGTTLEDTGNLINLTRERIRQIEVLGLEKLRAGPQGQDLIEGGLPDDTVESYDLLGLSAPKIKRRKKISK